MGHAKSLAAYRDIEAVLDTALRQDNWPATLGCESEKYATRWVARANSFRSVLREQEEARLGLEKGQGTCKYDTLKFTKIDTTVIINRLHPPGLVVGEEIIEPISDRDLEQQWEDEV